MVTTFADIIKIKQIKPGQYETVLDHDWCVGTVPNGGYVTSAFMRVASEHMRVAHSKRNASDVINLHLEFFRRTSEGPALFTVRDVKIGSRISNLQLTLSQLDSNSGKLIEEVQGYVTISNIASEQGLSVDTEYKSLPRPLPVSLAALDKDEDENYTRRGRDPFGGFRRVVNHIQLHLPRPEKTPAEFPKGSIDQWVRFIPQAFPEGSGRWTNDALGYVVDIFPQIIEKYVNPEVERAMIGSDVSHQDAKKLQTEPAAKYWYPTLVLNLDVKKALPANGVEWLFVRVKTRRVINGRFDIDIEVYDEHEELVATSAHASLVVDSSRNTTRKPKKENKL